MATKTKTSSSSNRYYKLSLKKNKLKRNVEYDKPNRSSDVIILDESYDRLKLNTLTNLDSKPKIYSPIVVDDSCTSSDDDLPKISFPQETPSKYGNVSFNCSRNTPPPTKEFEPSTDGWSPAQRIITADPKNNLIPTTPKDTLNKSHEQCSMKTVERSQKKILNELYGECWKSIPSLFKTIKKKYDNFDGVTKKLFDEDDDKENIRSIKKRDKEIYLTNSEIKRNETHFSTDKKNHVGDGLNIGTEKKCKKKLYSEKVPNTPEVPKVQKIIRNVNSTTKKVKIKKGMTVTDLVKVMNPDINEKEHNTDNLRSKTEISILANIENNFDTRLPKNLENILTKEKKNIESTKTVIKKDVKEKKRNENSEKESVEYEQFKNDILTTKGQQSKKIDALVERIENVALTPKNDLKRFSFVGSLADNIPSWRCHPEAFQYRDNFKTLKEQLSRRLYQEFNREVFGDAMDADMPILWDTKLRSTAGTTTNCQVKTARGDRVRSSRIKLSTKVLDTPQRLRDTLVHEMCHAATWLLDGELRAGHGPLWKKWASRALRVYPELGEISRCHDMEIHFKYSFKCSKCGYTIQRHSKSIDVTKKACGYCRGTFQIVVNKKNKDGVVVTTPARKATTGFALYVKENYATVKDSTRTHAQVMKLLGEQYAATKGKDVEEIS